MKLYMTFRYSGPPAAPARCTMYDIHVRFLISAFFP
jgi:hypothetical protein